MSRLLDKLKQAEQARKALATGAGDAAAEEALGERAEARRAAEARALAAARQREEAEAAALKAAGERVRIEVEAERLASERAQVEARAAAHARNRGAQPSPARRPWPVRALASYAATFVLGTGLGWFLSPSLLPKTGLEASGGGPLILKLDRNFDSFSSRPRPAHPPAIEK